MPFQFSVKDRTVQAGLRRIAREQAEEALSGLSSDLAADPEAVHAVRKASKKLRGLLHLARPVLSEARTEQALIAEAARQISGLRDAQVMQKTFNTLEKALPKEARVPLRAALDARKAAEAHPEALAQSVAAARETFGDFATRSGHWKIKGKEFGALEPGLTDTWRRARKGLHRAQAVADADDFPAEPFHDWRKRVKRHWYQARLLEPIWSEMMAPHVKQADALGELLGDHNDLDVLLTTLEAEPALDGSPALEPLRTEVLRRRRTLATDALRLGSRLFAEPADALADRWGRWWRLWRS